MRSTDTARNLSLQTPSSIIDRLDALTAWAAKQADISPTGHAQRAQVHRAALQLGLQLLEVRAANDGVLGVGGPMSDEMRAPASTGEPIEALS